MKIFVKVKVGSKRPKVEKIDEAHFVVAVSAKPVKGKANDAVIKSLAKYFDLSPSKILLLSGRTSKEKVFKINPWG